MALCWRKSQNVVFIGESNGYVADRDLGSSRVLGLGKIALPCLLDSGLGTKAAVLLYDLVWLERHALRHVLSTLTCPVY